MSIIEMPGKEALESKEAEKKPTDPRVVEIHKAAKRIIELAGHLEELTGQLIEKELAQVPFSIISTLSTALLLIESEKNKAQKHYLAIVDQ